MNTTGLNDVEIDLRGTLLVSPKYTNKLKWLELIRDLAVVRREHLVLAKQFAATWVPEPELGVVLGWEQYRIQWTRVWYL
jgi:hypothetical protein